MRNAELEIKNKERYQHGVRKGGGRGGGQKRQRNKINREGGVRLKLKGGLKLCNQRAMELTA